MSKNVKQVVEEGEVAEDLADEQKDFFDLVSSMIEGGQDSANICNSFTRDNLTSVTSNRLSDSLDGTIMIHSKKQKQGSRILTVHFRVFDPDMPSLNYEAKMYRYVTEQLVLTKCTPNLASVFAYGQCPRNVFINAMEKQDRNLTKKTSYLRSDKASTRKTFSVLATEKVGHYVHFSYDGNYIVSDDNKKHTTLDKFLQNKASSIKQDKEDVRSVLFQIIYTLHALSSKQVCHNDLHEQNIMIVQYKKPITLGFEIGMKNFNARTQSWERGRRHYKIKTKYIPYIIDWDRSSSPGIRDQTNPDSLNLDARYFRADLQKFLVTLHNRYTSDKNVKSIRVPGVIDFLSGLPLLSWYGKYLTVFGSGASKRTDVYDIEITDAARTFIVEELIKKEKKIDLSKIKQDESKYVLLTESDLIRVRQILPKVFAVKDMRNVREMIIQESAERSLAKADNQMHKLYAQTQMAIPYAFLYTAPRPFDVLVGSSIFNQSYGILESEYAKLMYKYSTAEIDGFPQEEKLVVQGGLYRWFNAKLDEKGNPSELHRDDDFPAVISEAEGGLEWWYNNERHRSTDAPAKFEFKDDNQTELIFYKHGQVHRGRDNRYNIFPAIVETKKVTKKGTPGLTYVTERYITYDRYARLDGRGNVVKTTSGQPSTEENYETTCCYKKAKKKE